MRVETKKRAAASTSRNARLLLERLPTMVGFLERYLDSVETLPTELHRNLTRMRELDIENEGEFLPRCHVSNACMTFRAQ